MMDPLYYDLKETKSESALGFLIEGVLRSRIEMGLKSDPAHSEEDVNIYLAFLLLEASLPTFRERLNRYTSRRDTDIFKMVEGSHDNSLKYLVYKTNGDHLLFTLGILQQETPSEPALPFFEKSRQAYQEYAKTYYQFASEYHHQIHRKVTGVCLVLDKLSRNFERYEKILGHLREEYLVFLQKTREEGFSKFMAELKQFEGYLKLREKQDLFLDQYALYRKTGDPGMKETLLATIKEIQGLDPSFVPPAL